MAVSHRTNLLVTGDFNASISYHPPYTGSGIFRAAKPIGRELFTRFVTSNNLLALNTFINPLPTFISATGRSQMDLQPAFQVTPTSKQVKVLSQFPLGAWRAGGRHRPLATSIVPYAPWVKSPSFRKLAVSSSPAPDDFFSQNMSGGVPLRLMLYLNLFVDPLRRPKLIEDFPFFIQMR